MNFADYPQDRFDRLRQTLYDKDLKIASGDDSGEIKKDGADLIYLYDVQTQTLTITVKHAPWMHSIGWFDDQINAVVENQR